MRIARALAITIAVLVTALAVTLALPVDTWRTGDQRLSPLTFAPWQGPPLSARIWIDTDAACGHGRRTDPDDCLAIALLARTPGIRIAGISTVFGNAPLDVVDRTTRELVARLFADIGRAPPPVVSGASAPLPQHGPAPGAPAHAALQAALEEGPLTLVALGPLTNIAAVMQERPDLRAGVARLVAVMGRRPGHIFHPAEGAQAGLLLGHGPVFRDLNFALDVRAVSQLVALHPPITLIPYDAARGVEVTADDLDALARSSDAMAWVAARARDWLDYWREEIGRQGFSPFDLLAAAYVVAPARFRCVSVWLWVGKDPTLFVPFWRPTALLVGQGMVHMEDPEAIGSGLYCAEAPEEIETWLIDRLSDPSAPIAKRNE